MLLASRAKQRGMKTSPDVDQLKPIVSAPIKHCYYYSLWRFFVALTACIEQGGTFKRFLSTFSYTMLGPGPPKTLRVSRNLKRGNERIACETFARFALVCHRATSQKNGYEFVQFELPGFPRFASSKGHTKRT